MAKGKNWIAGAIKHPGAEKRAAKAAGETTHQYMEEHKNGTDLGAHLASIWVDGRTRGG